MKVRKETKIEEIVIEKQIKIIYKNHKSFLKILRKLFRCIGRIYFQMNSGD